MILLRLFEIFGIRKIDVERSELHRILILLLVLGCGAPQLRKMSSPHYAQKDWTGATMRIVPLQDSVTVRAHGVSVFVFEYLDYDFATQTAEDALEAKFNQYFRAGLAERSKLKIPALDPAFEVPHLSEREFPYQQGTTLKLLLPTGNGISTAAKKSQPEFLLFIQDLTFDVREQYLSGRIRKVYLRLSFDYAIWDNAERRAATVGKVSLSESASFQVKRGTFEPTFSERTWEKTISKAAAELLKNTPFAK